MYNQAAQAYQKARQGTASPRELEAGLLMKSAAQLQLIIDNWQDNHPELGAAVTYNRRLWTVLVTSATSVDNPLPTEIKQNIANLGLFIFKHTVSILASPDPDRMKVLVSINQNVAEGLRSRNVSTAQEQLSTSSAKNLDIAG